ACGMVLVAIAAAVAFDPLFLLFHELFFPQGNFLFGPESNLIAMYPDAYWYGVTMRIAVTLVVAAAVIAVAATAALRRGRR
ncbi:MAG: lipoprotein intramolecular transacylase Lit, partial [Candidatus Limnocylindria bacterium]